MESSKSKAVLDKISLNHIAVDLGLSLLVGAAISLIIFLGFYRFNGAANLLEIIPMFFVLIFVNTPYSGLFRLVELVPIYAPVISILATRGLVQKAASRKDWAFTAFVVAACSAIVAVSVTIAGGLILGYGRLSTYGLMLAISPLFILLGFIVGVIPGVLFVPKKRIFKTLIAVITSALVGGFFEITFLLYITRQ